IPSQPTHTLRTPLVNLQQNLLLSICRLCWNKTKGRSKHHVSVSSNSTFNLVVLATDTYHPSVWSLVEHLRLVLACVINVHGDIFQQLLTRYEFSLWLIQRQRAST